ncbi:MAG: 3'-5' exonuclease [Candidatus Gastranaerophilales bacterium]|nr:3'-5' exonuclease [Candidatus Gastranaerophilales bacterium]
MKIIPLNYQTKINNPDKKSNRTVTSPVQLNNALKNTHNISSGLLKTYYCPSFKGDFFENNYTRKLAGKVYQGVGLMIKNELGTPEWYDFMKVGWKNLSKEPLDWKTATPKDFYVFTQANAFAEGYESAWVRRFNYTNRKKMLATSHSIDSRGVKEPPSKALKKDAYKDKSFASNIEELLDIKHHKSLDKPIFTKDGELCLDAVVFDTETTGTNTSDESKVLDKIIQIGAIQIKNGKTVEATGMRQLINPEMPIPAASSKVHGIFDKDVQDAPVMEKILKSFNDDYLNKKNGIIVAYNSQFDITMLNNAIREHNSFSADELKPKKYFKVMDPFLLIQRIHPYVGTSKRLSEQYKYFFCKNMDNAHDAYADVKGTVNMLKYSLYYLNEHRKDVTKPLTQRDVLLFQNGYEVPNINIKLDAQGCNSAVNFRTSYRPVSLSVDNYHDGYLLSKEDIKSLAPEIGEKNVKRLKNEVSDKKVEMKQPGGLPINAAETRQKPDDRGMENAFYVMKKNFNKVLDYAGIDAYAEKSREEVKELITQKAKHYIHKDSIDFWMKNPNPHDIKNGNDLPDFNICKRVMLEDMI